MPTEKSERTSWTVLKTGGGLILLERTTDPHYKRATLRAAPQRAQRGGEGFQKFQGQYPGGAVFVLLKGWRGTIEGKQSLMSRTFQVLLGARAAKGGGDRLVYSDPSSCCKRRNLRRRPVLGLVATLPCNANRNPGRQRGAYKKRQPY